MQKQCSVLEYKINLYFHNKILVIKIDENNDSGRKIDCETNWLKAR